MLKSVLYTYFANITECQVSIVADLHLTHFACVHINLCTVTTFSVPIFLVNVEVHLSFIIQSICIKIEVCFCDKNIFLVSDSVRENYK